MSVELELQAELREQTGKAAARRLRRVEDLVPATVYGAGKAPELLSLVHKDVLKAFSQEATFSSILDLKVGSQTQKVVLKAVQRHHAKPRIMHIDFLRVNASEKLTMNVPLHFVHEEESPGIKAGGVCSHLMTEVEVRCLPAHLPEHLEVDLSQLALDQSLHLSDLTLPTGVELTLEINEEHNPALVSIHVPKVSQADLDAETTEEAEASADSDTAENDTEQATAAEDNNSPKADDGKA